jgi:CRP-like cAMP-binding protein
MNQYQISSLVPLNALTHHNLELLAKEAIIETLQAGTHLFAQGDEDGLSVYLLSGEALLTTSDRQSPRVVVGGSDSARYPLAQLKPRQFSGIATEPVTVVRIDSKLIDRLLSLDQIAAYEITEFESSEDLEWMMRLLGSKAFHDLPAVNANALFQRFQPVQVKAGQIIIRQGEPGDYYYLVKAGTADVVRKIEKAHKVSVVDQITAGEGFGEDALLTGAPRNATVVMATDGVLMRLRRDDFNGLLREPLVNWLKLEEVRALVKAGAGLLDVRVEDEFLQGTIKGSVNLPLYLLRKRAEELEPGRHYIVFCQTGSRSGAAAFLLTQRGFQVSALRGGIDALRQNSP